MRGEGRGLTGSEGAREDFTDWHLATDSREERGGVERGELLARDYCLIELRCATFHITIKKMDVISVCVSNFYVHVNIFPTCLKLFFQ